MKKFVIIIMTCLIATSCSNDDDKNAADKPELLGNWKLIEIYADPGDGSGDFIEVESDKTISFEANDIVESNGNLCLFYSDAGEPSTGTYSEEDGTITVGTCGIIVSSTTFEIVDENLILSYLCIEACQEKYIKVN